MIAETEIEVGMDDGADEPSVPGLLAIGDSSDSAPDDSPLDLSGEPGEVEAEEAAEEDIAPLEAAEGEEDAEEKRKALAREGYRKRIEAQRQRQEAVARQQQEAQNAAANRQWWEQMLGEFRAARQQPTAQQPPQEEPINFLDDPDKAFEQRVEQATARQREENERLTARLAALEHRYQQEEWARQTQAQAQAQQQRQLQEWRENALEWDSINEGFFGKPDPATGEFRPGVFDAWEAKIDELYGFYPPEVVQRHKMQLLADFNVLGQQSGQNPMAYLEDHAWRMGVGGPATNGQQVPAAAPPQAKRARGRSRGEVAAARAAQRAGIAGNVGAGAAGGTDGPPSTRQEMQAAGIDGRKAFQMMLARNRGDMDRTLQEMLAMAEDDYEPSAMELGR